MIKYTAKTNDASLCFESSKQIKQENKSDLKLT